MRPEAELVIALARGSEESLWHLDRKELDWDLAGDLAAEHQVAGLCSWMWDHVSGLKHERSARPPTQTFLQKLRLAYQHHTRRNHALQEDLRTLQAAFKANGVDALFFKGPWLALCAYPALGTRPVGDIDVGIREQDYPGAVKALGAIGYAPLESPPPTAEEAVRQAHYRRQIRFQARARRPVELHFRLVNIGPPAPDESWIWATARTLPVGDTTLLVPGPVAMLLHLLLHANQHSFAVLRLLHDIRWTLVHDLGVLDPTEVAARVRELRCRSCAYHGLVLARDLAGAAFAADLLSGVQPSRLRRAVFSVVWRLPAVRHLEAPRRRLELEGPLLYLLEMGRLRDKLQFLRELIAAAGGGVAILVQRLRSHRTSEAGSGE